MKKMKIMLTAVGVMGIVGAALAFKAQPTDIIYCDDPALAGVACTVPVGATLTANDTFLFRSSCTEQSGGTPCALIDVYQKD